MPAVGEKRVKKALRVAKAHRLLKLAVKELDKEIPGGPFYAGRDVDTPVWAARREAAGARDQLWGWLAEHTKE